jgi:fumarate hydratase, class II
MNIAIILELNHRLYPSLDHLQKKLKQKSKHYNGYVNQITINIQTLQNIQSHLYKLFIDDIAGQTSMNENFGKSVVKHLKQSTGFNFISVSTKLEELNIYHMMMELSGALNTLAVTLSK